MADRLTEAEVAELERLYVDAASAWSRGFVSSVSGARFADVILGRNALPRLLAERAALREALNLLVYRADQWTARRTVGVEFRDAIESALALLAPPAKEPK